MRISIIVPSYNQGNFLPQTLDSILGQTPAPFQVIVADGGSTDDTVAVLREYAARYPQLEWLSEKDKGPADAVNKGLVRVRGDWVGICSSDDYYLHGAFAAVEATALANPDCGFLYGDIQIVDRDGRSAGSSNIPEFSWPAYFGVAMCLPQGSIFFLAALAREIGLWNPQYYGCDLDYWMRLVFRTRALKVPQRLSAWRVYPEQRTRPDRYRKIWDDFWRMVANSTEIQSAPPHIRRMANASCHLLALSYHPTGSIWAIRGHALAALWSHPTYWRYQHWLTLVRLLPGYSVVRAVYRALVRQPLEAKP